MRSLSSLVGFAAATLTAPLLLVGSAEASTPATAVQYGAGGWRYLETSSRGGPANFAAPWGIKSDLLARKEFTLPPGSTDLSVGLAIDNDYTVYLNGVQVGAGGHIGCASHDSVVLPVEDDVLRTGTNNGSAYRICTGSGHGKAKAKKPRKSGSTLPIKVRLRDESGANLSSRRIVVHATTLRTVDGSKVAVVKGSGAANSSPPNDFRYRPARAGYIFNLSTKGLSQDTWELVFTVDGEADPTYVVRFQIRS